MRPWDLGKAPESNLCGRTSSSPCSAVWVFTVFYLGHYTPELRARVWEDLTRCCGGGGRAP